MFKAKRAVAGLIILGTLMLTACGQKPVTKPTDGPASEVKKVTVETIVLANSDISAATTVNGKIAANLEVSVVPKTPGKVAEVLVDVGDRVKKGDVLIKLDSTDLQVSLKQSEAALAVAKSSQAQAKVRYQDAKKNLERMENLYTEGAISLQQLEMARTQLELADPGMADAQVQQATAALQMVQNQLANTVIVAPAAGIVSARTVEVGEMAAQMPVVTIVDIDKVFVETNVTEAEVNKLSVGQKVQVKVAAVSGEDFEGVLVIMSPGADARTKTFPVKIEIDNPTHMLKPGMFAEVKLATATRTNVVVIPKEAVLDSGGTKTVYIVDNGQAVRREITIGIADEARVEVLTGLAAGETLIVKGQHKVQDGTPVEVAGGSN